MEALVNLFSLAGRTAVITGGTRGIGAVMAIALAEAGADIILVQVSSPRGKLHKQGEKMQGKKKAKTETWEAQAETARNEKH